MNFKAKLNFLQQKKQIHIEYVLLFKHHNGLFK